MTSGLRTLIIASITSALAAARPGIARHRIGGCRHTDEPDPHRRLGGHALGLPRIPAPPRCPRDRRPSGPRRLAQRTDHGGSPRPQRSGREPGPVRAAGHGPGGARSVVTGGPARPAEPEVTGRVSGLDPDCPARGIPRRVGDVGNDRPTRLPDEAVVTRAIGVGARRRHPHLPIIRLSYGTRLPVASSTEEVVEVQAPGRSDHCGCPPGRGGGHRPGSSDPQARRGRPSSPRLASSWGCPTSGAAHRASGSTAQA